MTSKERAGNGLAEDSVKRSAPPLETVLSEHGLHRTQEPNVAERTARLPRFPQPSQEAAEYCLPQEPEDLHGTHPQEGALASAFVVCTANCMLMSACGALQTPPRIREQSDAPLQLPVDPATWMEIIRDAYSMLRRGRSGLRQIEDGLRQAEDDFEAAERHLEHHLEHLAAQGHGAVLPPDDLARLMRRSSPEASGFVMPGIGVLGAYTATTSASSFLEPLNVTHEP
jgi:hypothetical protein